MSYIEYPLDSLPDLGLISRDDFPETEFEGQATQLTEEHKKLLRSAYLWMQVCKKHNIPPSVRGSYSELWFILRIVNTSTELARYKKIWGNDEVVEERIGEYKRAIHGRERDYFNSDAIAYYNYTALEYMIGECAKVEVELEYIRKRYNTSAYNDGSSFHVDDIYHNYPLESLQDLHQENLQFTEVHKQMLRSGYLWMQTCECLEVPPTVKASYSELWYFLDYLDYLLSLDGRRGSAMLITREHEYTYTLAIHGRERYYLRFYDIRPFWLDSPDTPQFGDLKNMIGECARVEESLTRQKRMHGDEYAMFDPRKSRRT